MNDFQIVTVCNRTPKEPYYCLQEFARSVMNNRVIVLGTNPGEYQGLGDKPKLLYRAIKDNHIEAKNIIFSDCWDLVFSDNPKYLFERYKSFDAPFVISAERNCFPADLKDEYDRIYQNHFTISSFKYLNSGMIVAETDAMLEVLEAMDLENIPDDYRMEDGNMFHVNDQFLYQQIFLKQPVKMVLDYEQELCCTLHGVSAVDLDFTKRDIQLLETGTKPCAFHFNGSAKTDGLLQPILRHLRLN